MSRFFIVEDESLVAMLLEDMLVELGHEVVATAQRVSPAAKLASVVDADAAILDVNLAGDMSFPVAEELNRRGIPFMFATGYGRAGLDSHFPATHVVPKPFTLRQLELAIARL